MKQISDITKVTVWNATVSFDKNTGKFKADTSKNKWQVAVFTKNGNMTLAAFLDGMTGDAKLKAYTVIGKHSTAVVLAKKFADEFGLKAAEETVVKEYAAAEASYKLDEAEKAKRSEKAKADAKRRKANEALKEQYPELYSVMMVEQAMTGANEVAKTSKHEGFVKYVEAVSDVTMKLKADLVASMKALENLELKAAS